MAYFLKNIFLIILIITVNCQKALSDDVLEYVERLRTKLRTLQETGKIKTDYEPYIEKEFNDGETYDFIIVGAGSAGSALVHRLSEVSNWKILLLEAGGEPDIISDIPMWSVFVHTTDKSWKYYTEKEENIHLGFENQRMYWPRGKLLGGTSQLNYMLYSRGASEDYDNWAKLGNPGWSYEDVLPLFKKLETCKIDKIDAEVRGTNGPISVEEPHKSKAADIFIQAAQNAGHKYVDYNGRDNIGASHVQATLSKGFRCSGERCYIRPVKNRENLTIRLHSHVTKVLIEDNKAYGIEFEKNGQIYQAYANNEIILSGGTINSAHILLLSGIGPREELSKFGIEVIQELPVAQKMYDHPGFLGLGFVLNETISDDEDILSDESLFELYNEGSGILTSLCKVEGLVFTKTPLARNNVADIEIIFFALHFCDDYDTGLARSINLSRKVHDYICREYQDAPKILTIVILMHPESYGYLKLVSSSYKVPLNIHPRFLTDPEGNDMSTMIAGIKEALRIMRSPPFDKYGIKLIDRPPIGCKDLVIETDEYWECVVRHFTSTIFHHSTTCKMGPADDPESVVDNRLRVYGIKGLRVADVSIMPTQITGHTNVPAFMIGEKAAEMIKEEYLS
ncbi:FAD dependent oxidoreductase [Oryctes borbonicus]|uniref:FAD dependent oxidoreductase n=1 Tax=Oryctes borbonicus TaxID=1629725 RepID=A0A0T6BA19_9SCAR|nr:FAD dependent oxidoreductase [Oryctes borbonicus]